MSPAQLRELAQRYWESRHDLRTAAKGLLTYLNAEQEQRFLMALKHELKTEIAQLTDLKAKQAFAPNETSTPHLPLGQTPPKAPPPVILDGPPPVIVDGPPPGTDPNAPVTVIARA